MPLVWADNIEQITEENANFRKVVWTGAHSELTLMSLAPGEEIGLEVHPDHDQFLRFEAGKAQIKAGPARDNLNETVEVEHDWACIIPAGTWHNVINTGGGPLKLYTVYSPANHAPGTVHRTKAEADAAEAEEHR